MSSDTTNSATIGDPSGKPQPPPPQDDPNATRSADNARDAEKQPQPALAPIYSVFSTWQKRFIVLAAAATAFFSPLSAQIYYPAMPAIARDLGVSASQVNLTVTTYMVFQGVVPMFIGSLADTAGRRPAYLICFAIYIAANIGLALTPSYGALLGLRCLQSAGSSTTVALCFAVVADVITSAERGQYVAFMSVPVVLGPALGPVIGGLLSEYLGWRSIFWFLVVLSGVTTALIAAFFPETCREIVGDGSILPPPVYRSMAQVLSRRRMRRKKKEKKEMAALERQPSGASQGRSKFKMKTPDVLGSLVLLLQKETGCLLGISSIVFAGFYCIATALPFLFEKQYGYNEVEVGLMYLPMAAGSIGAAFIAGPLMSRNYERHCVRLGIPYDRKRQQDMAGFPIERVRLEIGLPLIFVAGASIIAWGWAVDRNAHVAAPSVVSFVLGLGIVGFNNTANTLLVDIHPGKAGTATGANNLTRCLVGAGATAAIVPMMNAMGPGWAFTLVGGLLIVCIPPLFVVMVRGSKWRDELARKQAAKKGTRGS